MNLNSALKGRILVLAAVIIGYLTVFLVLDSGIFYTTQEVSSLNMPIKAQFDTPIRNPTGLAYDGENIWLSSADDKTIIKLDPITGVNLQSLDTGIDKPWGMAWDGNFLWVIDYSDNWIYKVNVSTGEIAHSIKAPGTTPTGLAYNNGTLYVADFNEHNVFTIDSFSGSVYNQYPVPTPGYNPSGLAYDGVYLWISDISASYVFQVQPENGTVIEYYYSSGYYPSDLAWDGEYLWSLDYSKQILYKTSPGEDATKSVPMEVPSWLSLAFIITITPILLSIFSAMKKPEYMQTESKISWALASNIALIIAIMGSLYTSTELFRLIYSVVYQNKIVFQGNSNMLLYRFEIILCIYTFTYWSVYSLVKLYEFTRDRIKKQ